MTQSRRWTAWGQGLTIAVLLLIAAQSAYLLIQGESFCPTSGCEIVEQQVPIEPLVLNLSGFVFFTVVAALFYQLRRRDGREAALVLSSLLLAGIAAEGVLFTFQYQTGAFCLYCCIILGAIALLNVFLGARQSLRAFAVFAAVFAGAFLLTSPKGEKAVAASDIQAGVYAARPGQTGGEERYFFFAEECTHCKAALASLMRDQQASLHLNPLAPLQNLDLADLAVQPSFSPEANLAFLASLGIKTVPVLLVRQPGGNGMRLLMGEEQIISHVQGSGQSHDGNGVSVQSSTAAPQTDFLVPGKDGCSVDIGCSQ